MTSNPREEWRPILMWGDNQLLKGPTHQITNSISSKKTARKTTEFNNLEFKISRRSDKDYYFHIHTSGSWNLDPFSSTQSQFTVPHQSQVSIFFSIFTFFIYIYFSFLYVCVLNSEKDCSISHFLNWWMVIIVMNHSSISTWCMISFLIANFFVF